MLDLFTAVAAGKSDDSSRKAFTKKAMEQLDEILNMASPFVEDEDAVRQRELTMEQKLVLLNKLNASKDKSDKGILDQVLETVNGITNKAK